MVVNGAYRGLRAVLEALDTAKFCVSVRIDQVNYSHVLCTCITCTCVYMYMYMYIHMYTLHYV